MLKRILMGAGMAYLARRLFRGRRAGSGGSRSGFGLGDSGRRDW